MALRIYNTLSRQKEVFEPLQAPAVKIYVCGPTVYDLLHVGNFRGPVVYNLIRNWLEMKGFKVTYALNFTDVDDKIIKRAHERNEDPQLLSGHYIDEYKRDFEALGLKSHDYNPKVTETMPEIISLIGQLVENKSAYVADGDVMYSIASFPTYGKLSGRNIEDLQAGARVEVDDKKQNPLDFALWKAAKAGEPSWKSPWGLGRPGWHIECSAMIGKHLGEQIDIHGGGTDLVFPHHENELAQTEAATGKSFAKYWVHWNMLNFTGQKMSKSLGNITSLRQFLADYNSEIYKWMILSTHYRSICEFGEDAIYRAISGLARVYSALAVAEAILVGQQEPSVDPGFGKITEEGWLKVEQSLDDDFNTPEAFAALFAVVRDFNSQVKRGMKVNTSVLGKARLFSEFIKRVGQPMSLFQVPAGQFLTTLDDMLLKKMNINRSEVDRLVSERSQARVEKDFKKSDELRDKLSAMGISVMDTPQGSHWEVSK